MNDTIHLLKSHRSIRKYTNQAIDKTMLEEILLAGQSAATSSNIQATTIVRVTSQANKEAIYNIAGKQPQILQAPEFLVFCADMRRSLACCEMHGSVAQEGFSEHFVIATTDVSLFAQNAVVAAESLGLGICYIGAIRNNPQVVVDVLKLPKLVYPVFGLCLGYPDQAPMQKPRLPLSVILHEDTYNSSEHKEAIAKYDEEMRGYYSLRSADTKQIGWSEQMSAMLSKESRPHIKDFLASQGFLLK